MDARLRQALARAEEVAQRLADPSAAKDAAQFKTLGREHVLLEPFVRTAGKLAKLQDELAQAREMAQEADPELVALAKADLPRLVTETEALEKENLNWRSFAAQEANMAGWNIRANTCDNLRDHRGVLRYKSSGNPGEKAIHTALEKLIREAEAGEGNPRK